MDDHLLGYLLETLDPATRQKVETELQSNPDTRARLARLEAVLAPLGEDAADPVPPPGLVLTTLAHIAENRCARKLEPAPPCSRGGTYRPYFRRADIIAAAAMILVTFAMLLPLLARQWRNHERTACANNLRKYWNGLSAYTDIHEGEFPRVERDGAKAVAGIFVPMLSEAGLIEGVSIDCPAKGNRPVGRFRVRDLEALQRTQPDEFAVVASGLCGQYAYSLGYDEGNNLRGLRQDSGDGLPILADKAGNKDGNSANHGGTGQNVLYVGGNVRWATQPTVGVDRDHIYLNQLNRRQAGVSRVDTVLGSSDTRPYAD